MKTCAIMQPTFLPWAGYFSLIAASDVFFFLDDVQLEKQSWQTRNRILISGKVALTSVPVLQKKLAQTISETQIDDRTKWREKLCKTLDMNYRKTPYFSEVKFVLDALMDFKLKGLSELNQSMIKQVVDRLELKTEILASSAIQDKSNHRSKRLVDLCSNAGASQYLSPLGAKEYLLEDRFQDNGKVALSIFEFHPKPYFQNHNTEFVTSLSFVDVISNLGFKNFKNYIQDQESIKIQRL